MNVKSTLVYLYFVCFIRWDNRRECALPGWERRV